MEIEQIIPIVFAANEKYAPYIAVAITSIIQNANRNYFYQFHILQTELSENMQLRLESIQGTNYNVTCKNVESWCREGMYSAAYFSAEMYYRIMIPEIFQEYDKVIYLDCDIVVLGDISELYRTEFDQELLGGTANFMHNKMEKYVRISLELNPREYINSGVLVFHAQQCRKEKFTERAFDLLQQRDDFIYPDQDLINVMCAGKIKYLDPAWNFTWHYRHLQASKNAELHLLKEEEELFFECEKNPKIIHYTGEIKPWNNTNKYLSDVFWFYAKESVFYNLLIKRLARSEIDQTNNQLAQRVKKLENALQVLQNSKEKTVKESKKQQVVEVQYRELQEEDAGYLEKYNEVIGSFSYRLGRIITFPVRKSRDAIVLIRAIGWRNAWKRLPDKLRLYKRILLRR